MCFYLYKKKCIFHIPFLNFKFYSTAINSDYFRPKTTKNEFTIPYAVLPRVAL